MNRILHIGFIVLSILFLLSCNSSEEQEAKIDLEVSLNSKRLNVEISPIEKRNPIVFIASDMQSAYKFQYTAIINQKVGEYVSLPMDELSAQTIVMNNKVTPEIKNTAQERIDFEVFPYMLNIIFDNDIFNNTDYYYTNGARIELVMPFAKSSPINWILPGLKVKEIDFSGFSIIQNIYTPINPEANGIEYGDRPFAAYLSIGQFRESYSLDTKLQIKSALDLGVMGPLSFGEKVQSTVHDLEPIGWKYQLQNSFLINYYMHIEKGLISSPNIELNVVGQANVGTLYDKAGGGLNFRMGSFLPVYRGPVTISNKNAKNRQLQYWFSLLGMANFIAYDATLQGSMFNDKSPYVLTSYELNRVVFTGSFGFALYYDNFGVELENFYLSPEFKGANHFKYGQIKLVANF